MSFYRNQEKARQKTGLLIAYFMAAIILIILTVNFSLFLFSTISKSHHTGFGQWLMSKPGLAVSALTLCVIAGGSLFRILQLSKGGISVALMAGGVPLNPETQQTQEKVLRNVVEEMSIASGVPVPRIFILKQETGINAFVAGTEPHNTVLAVTQGALDTLTREELQGVIGHEYSHILNGDMRLNLRLMGILAGILLIGQIGEFLMRGSRPRRLQYSSSSSKDGNQLALIGVALMAIGYIGLFFGRLIKAAISRQREFLADASSVQFTRNPEGIAGALYAIKMHTGKAYLSSAHAEDMSHMCFGDTVKIRLSGFLATHPPLDDRIKHIDPALLPRMKARFRKRNMTATLSPEGSGFATSADHSPHFEHTYDVPPESLSSFSTPGNTVAPDKQALKSSIGALNIEHQVTAERLLSLIPDGLHQAAHHPLQAEIVLYSVLLLESRNHIAKGLQVLSSHLDATAMLDLNHWNTQLSRCNAALRLPLLDMTLGTLKLLEPHHRQRVMQQSLAVIKSDHSITLSEVVYYYLIKRGLQDHHKPKRSIKTLLDVEASLATLIATFLQSSSLSQIQQKAAIQQIMSRFSVQDYSGHLSQPPSPKTVLSALDQLNRLTPLLKQPVIDACVDCIFIDNLVEVKEVELLRAVSEALDCPMPPITTPEFYCDLNGK